MPRHLQACSELGRVEMPSLEQMGFGGGMMEVFGGDMGDMMAGMQANRKIQQSMQTLGQCEQMVARQEAVVQVPVFVCTCHPCLAKLG